MKNFHQYFVLKFFREEKFKTGKFFVKSLSDEKFSMQKKGDLRYGICSGQPQSEVLFL